MFKIVAASRVADSDDLLAVLDRLRVLLVLRGHAEQELVILAASSGVYSPAASAASKSACASLYLPSLNSANPLKS